MILFMNGAMKLMKNKEAVMIKAVNVEKQYMINKVNNLVLNAVSIEINDKELVAITGKSGAGKSTLIKILSTIDSPTRGKVEYKNERIDNLNQKEAAKLRLNEFGFVFQNYLLIDTLNVYDNIVISSALSGKEINKDFVYELCELLNLKDKLNKMPKQLSGGEQQRVAIARAVSNKPQIIFADEPTGNLDSKNSEIVYDMLLECKKVYNQTVLLVTHNTELSKKADRILEIRDGQVYE